MTAAYVVYSKPTDIQAVLAEMGLTEQILSDSARAGHEAAAGATRHHPKSYAGYIAWSETMKALRDFLAVNPHKWEIDDIKGQPLVVNPKGTIVLTVASGDEATGRPGNTRPKTKSTKGPVTLNAVASNRGWLFPELELDELVRINASKQRETWFLLICRDDKKQETRCELSCPILTDSRGRISDWSKRIILPSIPYSDKPKAQSRKPDDSNQSGEVTVTIQRKA